MVCKLERLSLAETAIHQKTLAKNHDLLWSANLKGWVLQRLPSTRKLFCQESRVVMVSKLVGLSVAETAIHQKTLLPRIMSCYAQQTCRAECCRDCHPSVNSFAKKWLVMVYELGGPSVAETVIHQYTTFAKNHKLSWSANLYCLVLQRLSSVN